MNTNKADFATELKRHLKVAREMVARAPQQYLYHNELGQLLGADHQVEEAVNAFDRAIALCPTYGDAWLNRCLALQILGRLNEAYTSASVACRLIPRSELAETKVAELGTALIQPTTVDYWPKTSGLLHTLRYPIRKMRGRRADATEATMIDAAPLSERELRARIAERRTDPLLLSGLANVLFLDERLSEAEHFLRYILAQAPGYAPAAIMLANIYEDLGHRERALAVIEAAKNAGSRDPSVSIALYRHRYAHCDWRDHKRVVGEAQAAMRCKPVLCEPFVALHLGTTAADHLAVATAYGALSRVDVKPITPVRKCASTGKLKIGYMSADFRNHPGAMVVAEMFELHDKRRFQIFGYATTHDDGTKYYRERIRAACDRFVEVPDHSHRQIAEMIYADGIDILVDLTGFTKSGRAGVLAYRPAPVQVNFIGYPGTMGPGLADYTIVNPIQVPTTDAPYFGECLVHLHKALLTDSKRPKPPKTDKRTDHGLPENKFVYCSFNRDVKLTPEIFGAWMRILKAVPDSVLWLVRGVRRQRL